MIATCYNKARVVLSAGRLMINRFYIAMMLLGSLVIAGCSSTSDSDSTSVYTVKRGDTLSRISRMTGTSVRDLARLNNISPPYTIEVGQRLKLNSASGTTQGKGRTARKNSAGSRTASTRAPAALPPVSWPPVGQRCWRWPTSGTVVTTYSSSDGGSKGIDIAGPRGQPVYAAGSGKVVYVGNQLRGYGNLIMIKHNDDYISAYAHNDRLMVNNGQSVKIGQQIATMGSSDVDSVRLHFQIRYRATAIDPLRYLPPQGSKPKC